MQLVMKYDFVPNTISQKIRDEKLKIEKLSDRDFEYYVAGMFKKLGYDADVTSASNDGGKDIVLSKSNERYYVECKHFSEYDLVGRPIIQKAFGAAMADSVTGCFIVTSSKFNSNALEEAAKRNLIYTMDIDDIAYINILPDGFIGEAFNCSVANKYIKLKQQYVKSLGKLSTKGNKDNNIDIVSENTISETDVEEEKKNMRWYHHPLVIGWLFIMCPPLSVYLWWKSDCFGRGLKELIAFLVFLLFVVAGCHAIYSAFTDSELGNKVTLLVVGMTILALDYLFARKLLFKNLKESVDD